MIDQIDYVYAARNPWGLPAGTCRVMRAYCQYGCTKLVSRQLDISERTVETHLRKARHLLNLPGRDIRLYLMWDRWAMQFDLTMSQKLITKEKPNGNKRT